MAKDVEIKIKVVNESGDIIEKTAKSMDDLEKSVSSLSKELANAPLGSAKFKELDSALKDNQKTLDKTKASTQTFGETLNNIKGPLGGVAQGFMGMGKAALSFVANPIGAVIAALGIVFMAVKKAINNSEEAMDGITKITAIFGGIIRPVMEFIESVAVAAINALAKGLETVAGWFGVSGKAAGDFADALDAQQDAEKDLAVTRAQTNAQLAATKEILSDTTAKYEDRVAALQKVKEVEEAQSKQELANAKEKLRLANESIVLDGKSEEAVQALRDAKIALASKEQEYYAQQRQFNKQEKSLAAEKDAQDKQIAAEQKARRDKAAADAKTRRDTALAADKVAIDQKTKYEEEYTLSLIKSENERALVALKFRQARELATLNEQISRIGKIKQKTEEEKILYTDLLNARIALKQNQGKQLTDLEDKQQEEFLLKQKTFNSRSEELQNEALATKMTDLEKRETAIKTAYQKEQDALIESFIKQEYTDADYQQRNLALTQLYNAQIVQLNQDKAKALIDSQIKTDDAILAKETTTNGKKLEILETQRQAILAAENLTEEARTTLLAENAKKRDAIEKASFDLRVQQVQGVLTAASDVAGAVQAVNEAQMARDLKGAGDNFAAQEKIKKEYFEKNKKVQIAQAIISTIQGAIGAFTSLSVIPVVGPVLGAIAAAAALVSGYANVDKIRSTQYVGGTAPGGGGGGGGSTTPPAPSMFAGGGYVSGTGTSTSDSIPARLSNGESVINANSTAQFGGLLSLINEAGGGRSFAEGGASNGNMNTPVIKTYVVASEMTSQQEADFRIKQVARL